MEPPQEQFRMRQRLRARGKELSGTPQWIQRARTEGTNLLLFKPSQVPPVVETHLFSLPVFHEGGS